MNFSTPEIIIITLAVVIILICAFVMFSIHASLRRTKTLEVSVAKIAGAILKMQSMLKARAASDMVAQNAEIIYQDLLQHLTPIMRASEISMRDTSEHELWRALGGILDEYNKNPFVLEQLRRLIKLDSSIARATDAFLNRAEHLLRHLAAADPDGILASSFADGLLGQSMTLLSQAKQLANQ
ncbi:MAG: hypothetical protein FWG18_00850 [Alphaproteobacteria bacterium]|nr:hypothetical protein [Alphaproteobacteria bacterium]